MLDPQKRTASAEELLPLVYEELRVLARQRMATDPSGQTLQPTALVHEAYLRLTKEAETGWEGQAHFFGAASIAMRRILIERARKYRRLKHGAGRARVTLTRVKLAHDSDEVDLLDLEEALNRLDLIDSAKCAVVTLRYLFGCTLEETARSLGISIHTVKDHWVFAQAWLRRELFKGSSHE